MAGSRTGSTCSCEAEGTEWQREGSSEGLRRLPCGGAGAGANDTGEAAQTIRAAASEVTETISYRLPTFKSRGKPLLALGAAKEHCSLYLMGYVPPELEGDLKKYDTGKGTVRFPVDDPLPASLVRKVVKVRVAQVASAMGSGKSR